ncbi:hypothetical protein GMORB2_1563 [Geosmithia morbida]|uniref:Tat pathway signal sequence n=1 Tax=Geosmithia morbida TaxID=1094350 RepID=A0A9P4YVF6_9HYPO|nr:uncharacterized protein GMORB2_1563 [Geosmithia morbida]KAF4121724.1 hypothetical protein GMORB2_1563 [Geosmithia morbida]
MTTVTALAAGTARRDSDVLPPGPVPAPTRPGSRSSLMSAPWLPSIAEDEISETEDEDQDQQQQQPQYACRPRPPQHRQTWTMGQPPPPPQQSIIWPRTPLRVPQKAIRRVPVGGGGRARASTAAASYGGHNSAEANSSPSFPERPPSASTVAASLPPPYFPITFSPPKYRNESVSTTRGGSSGSGSGSVSDSDMSEMKKHQHLHNNRPLPLYLPKKYGRRQGKSGGSGRDAALCGCLPAWMGGRRSTRWILLGGLGLFLIGMAVALAVGLTLGLERRRGDNGDSSNDNNIGATNTTKVHDGPFFPVGSYTIRTTLNQTSTSCTSNPATWRCDNIGTDETTAFRWIIYGSGDDSSSLPYTVSSDDNAFAPAFANLTAAVIDPSGPNERLVFEFGMDRTVSVPTGDLLAGLAAGTANSTCKFSGSRFRATLWTGRYAGNGTSTASAGREAAGTDFASWPARAEVVQSKDAGTGEPECTDPQGDAIVGVQAGTGQCYCDYTT